VLAGKRVMQQNAIDPIAQAFPWQEAAEAAEKRVQALDEDLNACRLELAMVADTQNGLSDRIARHEELLSGRLGELGDETRAASAGVGALQQELQSIRNDLARINESQSTAIREWREDQQSSWNELAVRVEAQETRLQRATLIPWAREQTIAAASAIALFLALLGVLGGHFLWR